MYIVSKLLSGANEFRDDYRYFPEAGGWFKLHRVPLDWQTARAQCYYEGNATVCVCVYTMYTRARAIRTAAPVPGHITTERPKSILYLFMYNSTLLLRLL